MRVKPPPPLLFRLMIKFLIMGRSSPKNLPEYTVRERMINGNKYLYIKSGGRWMPLGRFIFESTGQKYTKVYQEEIGKNEYRYGVEKKFIPYKGVDVPARDYELYQNICKILNLDPEEVKNSRTTNHNDVRFIFCHIHKLQNPYIPKTEQLLMCGNIIERDRVTVLHCLKRCSNLLLVSRKFKEKYECVLRELEYKTSAL